jgi:NADH-quinone oxidoreductase subunit C
VNAEAIAEQLGKVTQRREAADGLWLVVPDLNARRMAEVMRDSPPARLVTITGTEDDLGVQLIYHWDIDGELLNVTSRVRDGVATSIVDIWPAADWIEREIRDYYAIEFSGRADTPPLMLRDGDEPGLFSRTRTISRDADPSDTGWSERLGDGDAAAERASDGMTER